jgi:hypothetical protein
MVVKSKSWSAGHIALLVVIGGAVVGLVVALVLLLGGARPNLTQVDLEPLLIQAGDLQAGVSGAQVRDIAPKMFDGMPTAANTAYQQFAQGSRQIGGVAVFLYEQDVSVGYAFVAKGMIESEPVAGVGEEAIATLPSATAAEFGLDYVDILFRRCGAVAHIRMSGDPPFERADAIAYARRLDKRLQEVVC